jgi:hydrogenase maturation protease
LKTLVLGLGNSILTDDGVGIHVVRAVAARWSGAGVEFQEASVGGLRLLEVIAGTDRLILVDAIQTPGGVPGSICRLTTHDLRSSLHAGSTHDLSFQNALVWGRRMGVALPPDDAITVIAVEAEDVLTFGEALTPAVAAALPVAVEAVLIELSGSGL